MIRLIVELDKLYDSGGNVNQQKEIVKQEPGSDCDNCKAMKKLFDKPLQWPYVVESYGCQHKYPEPWHSITPPNCLICGEVASSYKIDCTDSRETTAVGVSGFDRKPAYKPKHARAKPIKK
jgi:hypothetical protein